MRPDLHREYKHPTTGLVARLNDIAKDFNITPSVAAKRLKKRIPLTDPTRPYRHKGSKVEGSKGEGSARTVRKIKALPKIFIKPRLGINPKTGSLQNKHELAASFGINVEYARLLIANGVTGKIHFQTESEKLKRAAKKKAAQEEMAKVIAALDERKAMMNV